MSVLMRHEHHDAPVIVVDRPGMRDGAFGPALRRPAAGMPPQKLIDGIWGICLHRHQRVEERVIEAEIDDRILP